MKTAFVLSGGSVRGAFQVGVIQALIERGVTPDYIVGTSVGALNGALLCYYAGESFRQNGTVDWNEVSAKMGLFWTMKVTKPEALAIKRRGVSVVWQSVRKRFKGLTDATPLRRLIDTTFQDASNFLESPVNLEVCTVNFTSGQNEFVSNLEMDFNDFLKASSAIPIAMQEVMIGGAAYFDGGLREVKPIGQALQQNGIQRIVAISCYPKDLSSRADKTTGNLMELVERLMDIILSEIMLNDMKRAKEINMYLSSLGEGLPPANLVGKRNVDIHHILPQRGLNVSLSDFNSEDISNMIRHGYNYGKSHPL